MKIHIFTFNPFSENTYIVSGDSGTCTIIDPGCYDSAEFEILHSYVQLNNLRPSKVVLTHAHLDHVFGLKRCLDEYDVSFFMHDAEKPVLDAVEGVASMYGVICEAVTAPHKSIDPKEGIEMGGDSWRVYLTPGHSPGSVCLHHAKSNQLIGGDVLFRDSIGRTDLPGGHHKTLLDSITDKLYVLPEDTIVYPGHGPSTSIGYEKRNNPFVRG